MLLPQMWSTGSPPCCKGGWKCEMYFKIKVINKDESGECVRKPLVLGLKVCISWVFAFSSATCNLSKCGQGTLPLWL